MEAPVSFAPLAARVDEIRPLDGAEVSWANFMALFVCAILQMLILLCEALDARAAADARLAAAPAARDGNVRPVLAVRSRHPAMPGAGRAPRLVRADDAQPTPPTRDLALAETAEPPPHSAWPAWAPPWPGLCWRPPRSVVFLRKERLSLRFQHIYFVTIQK